ncbi:MAG: UDP-N-acetylglucosamine pyrophosphorylase [Syntrophales bacterium]|nr:UDP-N-acetylglucosamine pyrophosphorylase [Syntrophales bacterium]
MKLQLLLEKGVRILHPASVYIGPEVPVDNIADRDVKIYPGCRIMGANTVISPGVSLGREGPVTVEDCQIGAGVSLAGGYFRRSVFLERVSLGADAHVREGCLLEEEAGGGHGVGLKQTILMPFVTLGSLINFCDCLMAGGTSRKDHSEVGSSFIHFNFTPDGDKTTPSLIGDVPRGVMLRERPIFLGGQGGIVGPAQIAYGTVTAAGTIVTGDITEEDTLVFPKVPPLSVRKARWGLYGDIGRMVRLNILYLANLTALEEWYRHVRRPFFNHLRYGNELYRGAMAMLAMGKAERIRRLVEAAGKMEKTMGGAADVNGEGKRQFLRVVGDLERMFSFFPEDETTAALREQFTGAFLTGVSHGGGDYVKSIKTMPETLSVLGTAWLKRVVAVLVAAVAEKMPALGILKEEESNNG